MWCKSVFSIYFSVLFFIFSRLFFVFWNQFFFCLVLFGTYLCSVCVCVTWFFFCCNNKNIIIFLPEHTTLSSLTNWRLRWTPAPWKQFVSNQSINFDLILKIWMISIDWLIDWLIDNQMNNNHLNQNFSIFNYYYSSLNVCIPINQCDQHLK